MEKTSSHSMTNDVRKALEGVEHWYRQQKAYFDSPWGIKEKFPKHLEDLRTIIHWAWPKKGRIINDPTGELFEEACKMPKDLKPLSVKAPMNLLPARPLRAISAALEHGAIKYSPWNWQDDSKKDERVAEQLAALLRHVTSVADPSETDHDEESGLHHLAHAGACIIILLYKLGIDYQPSKIKLVKWETAMDDRTAGLIAVNRLPDSTPPPKFNDDAGGGKHRGASVTPTDHEAATDTNEANALRAQIAELEENLEWANDIGDMNRDKYNALREALRTEKRLARRDENSRDAQKICLAINRAIDASTKSGGGEGAKPGHLPLADRPAALLLVKDGVPWQKAEDSDCRRGGAWTKSGDTYFFRPDGGLDAPYKRAWEKGEFVDIAGCLHKRLGWPDDLYEVVVVKCPAGGEDDYEMKKVEE